MRGACAIDDCVLLPLLRLEVRTRRKMAVTTPYRSNFEKSTSIDVRKPIFVISRQRLDWQENVVGLGPDSRNGDPYAWLPVNYTTSTMDNRGL